MQVGYIGLGNIGTPIAEQILRNEKTFVLWNRTRAKMEPFIAAGAIPAASPADLANRSDIVALCIDSEEGLREILFGQNGVTSAKRKPRLVVDHSTTHPSRAIEFGAELARAGVAFIDAPVSGAASGAQRGTLAVFVGGEAADLEIARPMMQAYAGRISHMGPTGAGQATKACNQIVNFCSAVAIAEALALADAMGLDSKRLPDVMKGGLADSNLLQEYARAEQTGEKTALASMIDTLAKLLHGKSEALAKLPLEMLLKDLTIVADLARKSGSSTPMIGLAESFYRQLNGKQSQLLATG